MNNKIRTITTRALWAGAALALSCGSVMAATVSVSGDTQVATGQGYNSGGNYGTAATMAVVSGGLATSNALLGFDLGNSSPSSPLYGILTNQITKATLTVFVNKVTNTGTVQLGICSPWGATPLSAETSLTWDSPAACHTATSIGSASVPTLPAT